MHTDINYNNINNKIITPTYNQYDLAYINQTSNQNNSIYLDNNPKIEQNINNNINNNINEENNIQNNGIIYEQNFGTNDNNQFSNQIYQMEENKNNNILNYNNYNYDYYNNNIINNDINNNNTINNNMNGLYIIDNNNMNEMNNNKNINIQQNYTEQAGNEIIVSNQNKNIYNTQNHSNQLYESVIFFNSNYNNNKNTNNISQQKKQEQLQKLTEKEKGVETPTDNNRNKIKKYKSVNNMNKKKDNNKSKKDKLKLNEEILLKNQKKSINKDLDIKSHFDIEVTKEQYVFPYKKVLKIATPLLSHYEMPAGYEYKSPLLSPDGQYLSCVATSSYTDIVYVWSIDNLYWFKYKFSIMKSKVDYVAFTPDSKNILIIYRKNNPALYNLNTGDKILELEKNEEENKIEGLHCAFTVKGNHFCYTTEKSFTLWSLKNGKIKKVIKDESPLKLLFNEYIISIKNDLYCEIKNFKTLQILQKFKLKGILSPKDILDARFNPDMSNFIYVIKQGVIKYIIKEKKFKGIQKFQLGVEKAVISDDCRFVAKTNLRNITIYDIEKGDTIGTILKEKFNEFRIDFNNEKLIVIDNICINIHDYTDGGIPEQFVWLNKNPIRFLDVKFSPDFKFLFGLTEKNNVILYDLSTGLIIKKWQNIEKNWKNFTISEGSSYKTASTSNIFLVKIWGYITGREDATFYGFDSYSFNFSKDSNYLACGAKNGPEIARIWNIEKGTFGSFPYVGNNSNFHTVVNLTSPEPTRLICCSIDQQPLIFDTNSKELLYKCECLYRFEEIYEIQSDQKYDVFLVKGRDVKKRDLGLLYRISDGILLEIYENYIILELAKDNGVIISKCDNINGGKLTSTDLKNLSDPILNDFQIQTDKITLLNDNKCVVISNGDEYKTEYYLLDAEDGGYIGKIKFFKKADRYSENYITIDPIEEFIYFRYFEFLSPQESKTFRNILFGKSII